MSLKKYTFNQKRILWLSGVEKQLKSIRFSFSDFFGGNGFGFQQIINKLFSEGYLPTELLEDNVKEHYGYSDNEEDIEYKLARILFLLFLIGLNKVCDPDKNNVNYKRAKILIDNSILSIKKYLPEYTIQPFEVGKLLSYETMETKTVTENLNDIPHLIANPIVEMLKPMKNENELIGLISKVYKDIENVNHKEMENLNDVDKGILKRSKELAKMLVNNVTSAKGHNGISELKIKDIAHNFALNASLVQKLIQINNK